MQIACYCISNWDVIKDSEMKKKKTKKMDSKQILFIWPKAETAQRQVGTGIGQAWCSRSTQSESKKK